MSSPSHLTVVSSVIFARAAPALRAAYLEAANMETGELYDDDFSPTDSVWAAMVAADEDPATAAE